MVHVYMYVADVCILHWPPLPWCLQETGVMMKTTLTHTQHMPAKMACWPWAAQKARWSASGEPTMAASPWTCAIHRESPPTWTCDASPSHPWTLLPLSEWANVVLDIYIYYIHIIHSCLLSFPLFVLFSFLPQFCTFLKSTAVHSTFRIFNVKLLAVENLWIICPSTTLLWCAGKWF